MEPGLVSQACPLAGRCFAVESSPTSVLDADAWHQDATRDMTFDIIAKLEPVGVVFQFLGSFISGLVDPYAGSGAKDVVLGLALTHLPLAMWYLVRGGPFKNGARWLWIPCLQALLLPIVAGLLTQPDRYGANSCTPLCNYAAPTILFLTMYFQVVGLGLIARIAIDVFIVLVPVCVPFVLVLIMDRHPSAENFTAMFTGQLQLVVGYLIGRAAVGICSVAVGRQTETQKKNYDEFFNFLHSHVKAGLAAVKAEQPNIPAMLDKLGELEQSVSDRRLEMLFVHERIPLAVVISERIRAFTGKLVILESPRVGLLYVARPVGVTISRAMGDLLQNVVTHGGSQVRIRCEDDDDHMVRLEIVDNGPGFDPSIFDNPSKSLHQLRNDARRQRGDLTMSVTDEGTSVRLVLPLG